MENRFKDRYGVYKNGENFEVHNEFSKETRYITLIALYDTEDEARESIDYHKLLEQQKESRLAFYKRIQEEIKNGKQV